MNKLQCVVRGPGCLGEALYVCHHCGRPVCSRCDNEMRDPQFAPRTTWRQSRPLAHHCPKCYHPGRFNSLLKRIKLLNLGRIARKFSP